MFKTKYTYKFTDDKKMLDLFNILFAKKRKEFPNVDYNLFSEGDRSYIEFKSNNFIEIEKAIKFAFSRKMEMSQLYSIEEALIHMKISYEGTPVDDLYQVLEGVVNQFSLGDEPLLLHLKKDFDKLDEASKELELSFSNPIMLIENDYIGIYMIPSNKYLIGESIESFLSYIYKEIAFFKNCTD